MHKFNDKTCDYNYLHLCEDIYFRRFLDTIVGVVSYIVSVRVMPIKHLPSVCSPHSCTMRRTRWREVTTYNSFLGKCGSSRARHPSQWTRTDWPNIWEFQCPSSFPFTTIYAFPSGVAWPMRTSVLICLRHKTSCNPRWVSTVRVGNGDLLGFHMAHSTSNLGLNTISM